MPWTDVKTGRLLVLWAARDTQNKPLYSKAQIALRIGVSFSAVVAKLGRERIAGRIEKRMPAIPVVVIPTERYTNGGGVRSVRPGSRKRPALFGATLSTTPRAPSSGEPIAPPTSCQFPLWADGVLPPRPPSYCGAECVEIRRGVDVTRLPYCACHSRVAFNIRGLAAHA